jgi:hypothetical protein
MDSLLNGLVEGDKKKSLRNCRHSTEAVGRRDPAIG